MPRTTSVASTLLTVLLVACGGSPPSREPSPERARSAIINRLAVGDGHSCVVAGGGRVTCWGSYADETPTVVAFDSVQAPRRFVPTEIAGVERTVELRAGAGFACARDEEGAVRCWGNRAWGASATQVRGIGAARRISAGTHHVCAIHGEGRLSCWGPSKVASGIAATEPVTAVATANGSVCARLASGPIRCFPADAGDTDEPAGAPITILDADAGRDVTEIVMFVTPDPMLRGCVLRRDGTAECFFYTQRGTIRAPAPAHDVVSLGVGLNQSCAAQSDGAVSCWEGGMSFGFGFPPSEGASEQQVLVYVSELFAHSLRPAAEGLDDVVEVGIGNYHRCVLRRDGRVSCWGQNFSGGLGVLPFVERAEAGLVPRIDDARHLFVQAHSTCAVRAGDRVTCWGAGTGVDGGTTTDIALPAGGVEPMSGPCLRFADGRAQCFSYGDSPADVGAVERGALVAFNEGRVCTLGASGPIRRWITGARDQPVEQLVRPGRVVSLACTGPTTYALLEDGAVVCDWPRARGARPRRAAGIEGMVGLTVGPDGACTWSRDGRIACFEGCPSDPQWVTWLSEVPGVVEVSRYDAEQHHIAVRTDQGRVLFGVGEGGLNAELTDVHGLPGEVAQVVAGRGYGCARARAGGVYCWGTNASQELGVPSHLDAPRAQDVPGVRL